jgi:hypothetical protein
MNDKGQRISGAGGVTCDSRHAYWLCLNDGNQTFDFNVTLELVKTRIPRFRYAESADRFWYWRFWHEGMGDPTISYAGNVILKRHLLRTAKNLTVNWAIFRSAILPVGTLACPRIQHHGELQSTVQPEVKITSANGYETVSGRDQIHAGNGVATGSG